MEFMSTEIEHKFLVNRARLPRPLPAGNLNEQGYLCADPAVRGRVIERAGKATAFLTIKGKGLRVRAEYEYPIPLRDARKLMKLCGKLTLRKLRRRLGR